MRVTFAGRDASLKIETVHRGLGPSASMHNANHI